MLEQIPNELKLYPQWIVWKYHDVSVKVPYNVLTGYPCHAEACCVSFEHVVYVKRNFPTWYDGIGFVLTDRDPYCLIDLDDTEGNQADYQRQLEVYNYFQSYAERSVSGKGLHILVRGAVPSGRKRSYVEIYSNHRYMVMTGDIYRNFPIVDYNDAINALWRQMEKPVGAYAVGYDKALYTDETIYHRALGAQNGQKFYELWNGLWQNHYPSQSEADFALINIIAFYSLNRAQVKRMFLMSALGQRSKAERPDYMKWMLNRCFDRMLPPIDLEGMRNDVVAMIEKQMSAHNVKVDPIEQANHVCTFPPGLVGEIASFILAQAPRPVPEIALAAALGLMAGITGRAFNVSDTGLNMYILMIAETAIGKEAMQKGTNKLMSYVEKILPAASTCIGPGSIASPQAILKYMARGRNSICSIVGEFGIYLQQMTADNANSNMEGIMRFLLEAYNKSGNSDSFNPMIYSDPEKNTAVLKAPAFTLLGESTPETFYEGLHEGLVNRGLIPRFLLIEYKGERTQLNKKVRDAKPSQEMVHRLATLCQHAMMLNCQDRVGEVELDAEATKIFDSFNSYCEQTMRAKKSKQVIVNLWSRAHVKALRVAAIVAVGCGFTHRTKNDEMASLITADIAQWAINLVVADVRTMVGRFDAGEIGMPNDETRQINKIVEAIQEYVCSPFSKISSYVNEGLGHLHNEKIIPYGFLQRRLFCVAAFKRDKLGATVALKRALKTLCDRGDLEEIPRFQMEKDFKTKTLAYAIKSSALFKL